MKNRVLKTFALLMCLVLSFSVTACNGGQEADVVSLDDVSLEQASLLEGSVMCDYTFTDINGNSYTISQLLSEKKAVVLNFWFINCGPCRMEFPYLNEAYNAYKDELEVIAVDCVGDSKEDITAFAREFGLTFPVAEGDPLWQQAMHIQGYPTTVVIDRFGKIALKHTGYLSSTEAFEEIFELFTADDYSSSSVENLDII